MQRELDRLRTQVLSLAGKYSQSRKTKELDQVFALLAKEFESRHVQSQRVMVLLRAIMNSQPGSAKVVNEFLRSPNIAAALQSSGGYNLE